MGVNVQRYKGRVFLVSSMYAGLSGVLYALSIGSIAPESFGLEVSIQYLAMIVLGGLGSVGWRGLSGACSSARCRWSSSSTPTSCPSSVPPAGRAGSAPARPRASSTAPPSSSSILFEPAGLAGLARRFRRSPRPEPGAGSGPAPDPGPMKRPAPARSLGRTAPQAHGTSTPIRPVRRPAQLYRQHQGA